MRVMRVLLLVLCCIVVLCCITPARADRTDCCFAQANRADCRTADTPACCEGFYYTGLTSNNGYDACAPCPIGYRCVKGIAAPTPCSPVSCASGQYATTCNANNQSTCLACPTCSSGQWRAGCAGASMGTCTACRTCPAGSQKQANCAPLSDVTCLGLACHLTDQAACGGLFCNVTDAVTGSGQCAPCPPGWRMVDGSCVTCPHGVSCDEQGIPACEGDCPADTYPVCDSASGFVECNTCQVEKPSNAVAIRGGVLNRHDLCHAYTVCSKGYTRTLSAGASFLDTALVCVPCVPPAGGQVRFLTRGLSNGNPSSCLYSPASVSGSVTSPNEVGTWGNGSDTCPVGYTSVPGAAATQADCVPCAPLPPNVDTTIQVTYDCQFKCADTHERIGQQCVETNPITCSPGYIQGHTGLTLRCLPTRLPWNTPGYYTVDDADTERTTPVELDTFPFEASAAPSADAGGYVVYSEAAGPSGTSHTYAFASNTRTIVERQVLRQVLRGVTTREWELPGRVCSSATAQGDDGHTYVYMCLCNASFVAFLNASVTGTPTVTNAAVRVDVARHLSLLTGSVTESDTADGLRDQARFGTTLAVAVTATRSPWGAYRLFALDQIACRLVEVSVGTPGAFVNHAQSIFTGCTDAASIRTPHMLTPVLNGAYLLFLSEEGLYQVDLLTYSPRLITSTSTLPASIQRISAVSETALRVWNDSARFDIQRPQAACRDGTSSTLGSGTCEPCLVTQYASTVNGITQCTQCSTPPTCPRGTFLTPCTLGANVTCTPCRLYPGVSLLPDQPHNWVEGELCVPYYVLPCPDGYWGSGNCAKCPENTYTLPTKDRTGTSVDCICSHCGYRDADGACVVPSPYAQNRIDMSVSPECTAGELALMYATNTEWADGNGCNGELNGSTIATLATTCARTCPDDALLCTECGATGFYLEQHTPKICKECPNGTWGSNGLECTACLPLRVSIPDHTACVCGYGTVFLPPEDCTCPVGHEVVGNANAGGCTPCKTGHYKSSDSVIPSVLTTALEPCAPCPPGTEALTTGATHCTPCEDGMFNAGGQPRCEACAGTGRYADDPTTGLSCIQCDTECGVGTRATPCPLQPVESGYVRCMPCTPPSETYASLQADSWEWVPDSPTKECAWQCKEGASHFLSEDMACTPCASVTAAACTPGTFFTPCTRFENAHCAACVNETMPLEGAEWIPRVACSWQCAPGYTLMQKEFNRWTESLCVQQTENDWEWWSPS